METNRLIESAVSSMSFNSFSHNEAENYDAGAVIDTALVKPTILLVEDNKLIRLCMCRYIHELNCTVVTAEDGEEALERYHSSQPDIILLDIQLPKISGIDVCRTIREEEKNNRLPIVALTGFGDIVEDVCRDAGVDDFFVKPIEPDVLKQLLHRWLPEYRDVIREIS